MLLTICVLMKILALKVRDEISYKESNYWTTA